MKQLFLIGAFLLAGLVANAQTTRDLEEISEDNSWLKLGLNAGVPMGDVADISSFAFGLEAAGQFMRTDNFGLGIASGYTHYFKKSENTVSNDFGVIPLGLMFRYYPEQTGFFAGADLGYSFFTGDGIGQDGGAYVRPHAGYHNYDWNIFGYYNHVFGSDPGIDVQTFGLAVTYNIRFN